MVSEPGWNIVKHPHLTEKGMDLVDRENKLVLVVDERSNKPQIKQAVEDLFDVEVASVNTLNDSGRKKAYVKLTDEYDALDVATRLGML